ncbi:MAG: S41 family peptidase [Prevotella sp.]|jgi:carboxyl-terminal processing protease|nr:S41 family peptidase [Prevotella sp.]
MKRNAALFLSVTLFLYCNVHAQDSETRYFDINKNIEIFNSVVKELDLFYVDSLDINKSVQSGIVNMLAELDPYTNYITEKEMDDFKFITTGEYAGIGSYIMARKIGDSYRVMISGPYENMPAAKAGLREGDIILTVDGEDMTQLKDAKVASSDPSYGAKLSSQVSSMLKGRAGTIVKVKVERPGEKKPLEFKITRENIQVSAVPYYGVLENNTGYIAFTGFTDKSALDAKRAFLELKKQGIQSLILDLRGNGGGILEEAVQLVNFFVPRGEIVLSTKGKLKQTDRIYRTTVAPIDVEIPMAVLVDRGSASAAEIVSGALQDLDRAAIVGERTYGKGLVQVTRELPYGGSLKVTTSKYYIPSGRCIQAIDYTHRNEDGSVGRIPDSLTTVFKTSAGREVRDGGGIVPDITIKEDKTPSIAYYMLTQYIIFDFVTGWVREHPGIAPVESFGITDEDYEKFKAFVKTKKNFKYDMLSEKTLASLKEVMEYEGYMNTAGDEFKALEAKLSPDIDRDMELFKDNIKGLINNEIVKRYYYRRGEIQEELKTDKGVKEAIALLNDAERYKKILSPNNNMP